MGEIRIPVTGFTAIQLDDLQGDLRVQTWDKAEIVFVAAEEVSYRDDGDRLSASCSGGCHITIPSELNLHFTRINGDASIARLAGEVSGESVSGDLHLDRAGSVRIKAIGGDAALSNCHDVVRLGSIGGDLLVTDATCAIAAICGGDARINYSTVSAGEHVIQAGGVIACRLPADADVTVNLQYGGALRASERFRKTAESGRVARLVLGEGLATLNLVAGGDISLDSELDAHSSGAANATGYCSEEFVRQLEDVTARISLQLGALCQRLSTQLGALPISDDVAEKVQRSVQSAIEHTERKVNQAMAKAERQAVKEQQRAARNKHRSDLRGWASPPASSATRAEPAGDEERASVLRMLEAGKISPEQADELLSAMKA